VSLENVEWVPFGNGQQIHVHSTDRLGASDIPPMVENGVVYAGSTHDGIYEFSTSNGQELWRCPASGPPVCPQEVYCLGVINAPPVVSQEVVYGGDLHGFIALSAQDGHELWDFPTATEVTSPPVVVEGVVYVASALGFFALSAQDGHQLWDFLPEAALLLGS